MVNNQNRSSGGEGENEESTPPPPPPEWPKEQLIKENEDKSPDIKDGD